MVAGPSAWTALVVLGHGSSVERHAAVTAAFVGAVLLWLRVFIRPSTYTRVTLLSGLLAVPGSALFLVPVWSNATAPFGPFALVGSVLLGSSVLLTVIEIAMARLRRTKP